ncbi:nucleoside-diphosphate kinase [Mesorhizobium sp.]|uniref:nucleoside-diphosphate kinase n=1 Tax=Mesorhizobium sp. TaxID=1871066 RepID=UPI000FE635E8|nr:nucleoside-diphosphate kinase [Mesorhizobium sp.]RWG62488.1 MAG: nucleoside-diphosphate kinase [Mesorhizobium sp.]
MTRTIYRLTPKDLAVLEAMLMRRRAFADAIVPMLERKLAESNIIPAGMVEPDIATLNSRVVFRINDGAPETRTLMLGDASAPVGFGLPLGMRAGQSVVAERPDGSRERILLEDVAYQPEAKHQAARTAGRRPRSPRLVYSAAGDRWPLGGGGKIRQTEGDDPGPSEA